MESARAAYDDGARGEALASLMLLGKDETAEIRDVLAEMGKEEQDLGLKQRSDAESRGRFTLFLFAGASFLFALVVVVVWTQRLRAEREQSRRTTEDLHRDIDLERQVQQSLREALGELARAREEAEQASRSKDEFLAVLGHELRNPLSPIALSVHILRSRGVDLRELEVIERQTTHLSRLVEDLLDVSRITRGRVVLTKEAVDVAEIVAAAIETASPLIESGRHSLGVQVTPQSLVVDADRVRMTQVIANLLTNAAKYTPPGGRIDITAVRGGGEAVITVRDTGVGISAELLPRVFDVFVQERQTLERSQGGLGLGLAIVKSLVTMHGGSVTAASEGLGRGSTFTLRLAAIDAAAATQKTSVLAPVPESQGERLLLVDDNVDLVQLLATWLEALGYRTAVAHDGEEALRVAAGFAPEVALLDIGLPVMDGYELAERLREQLPDVKLVAITGYGQPRDRELTRSAGFQGHLTKPVDPVELGELLAGFESSRVSSHEATPTLVQRRGERESVAP